MLEQFILAQCAAVFDWPLWSIHYTKHFPFLAINVLLRLCAHGDKIHLPNPWLAHQEPAHNVSTIWLPIDHSTTSGELGHVSGFLHCNVMFSVM